VVEGALTRKRDLYWGWGPSEPVHRDKKNQEAEKKGEKTVQVKGNTLTLAMSDNLWWKNRERNGNELDGWQKKK